MAPLLVLTLLPALLQPANVPDRLVVEVHDVGVVDLGTAAAIVRPLLSPEGRVVEEARSHRLVVVDLPSVQRRVREALRRTAHAPVRNVRVRVVSEWRVREAGGGVALGGGRGTVTLRGGAGDRTALHRTQQEVLVSSGREGSIRVAEEVPYAEWFLAWGIGHGVLAQGTQWRDVSTSLAVEPTVLSDGRVRVKLTPQLEYWVDRGRQVTALHRMATEVVVRPGEELLLGGVPSGDVEFRERFLVGYDARRGSQSIEMRLTATVE